MYLNWVVRCNNNEIENFHIRKNQCIIIKIKRFCIFDDMGIGRCVSNRWTSLIYPFFIFDFLSKTKSRVTTFGFIKWLLRFLSSSRIYFKKLMNFLTGLGWIFAFLSKIKIVLLRRTNLWFSILIIDDLKKKKIVFFCLSFS